MLRLAPTEPFRIALSVALPHGLAAFVRLPGDANEVPGAVLDALHPDERALAEALHGFRQPEFVGGRLALAALFSELGGRPQAIVVGPRGEPRMPSGFAGSVTHKRDVAVGLLARVAPGTTLGVDLEDASTPREGIAERVLRPEELAAVRELPPERQWVDTVTRFALKEAVYKALAPVLQRMIGFEEAAAWPAPDGNDRVELFLAHGEGPFVLEARHAWVGSRVLATIRARQA